MSSRLTPRDPDAPPESPVAPVDVQGRVIEADGDGVTLQIDGGLRTVRYADLGPGRVQVEFGRPADAGDAGESWDGPGEEGPDGH